MLLLFCAFQPAARCEDHLEIKTEITCTFENPARTNLHRVLATCVVGTNDWFIAGDFLENARLEYWLVGTHIAECTTITSGMYLERAKDLVSEKLLGQKNTSLSPVPTLAKGRPISGCSPG